jgi:hypothetical protein
MRIWYLENENAWYGKFSSCVVIADDETAARLVHPTGRDCVWNGKAWMETKLGLPFENDEWPVPADLKIRFLGDADPDERNGVVCSSFIG